MTEYVTVTPEGDLNCLCGNRPDTGGFYPCNTKGEQIEPLVGIWPEPLYVCADCERIILYPTGNWPATKAPVVPRGL